MRIKKENIMDKYITCDECGYNNEKHRFEAFGTCLHCGKILDNKTYFKAQMVRKSIKVARAKGKYVNQRNLIF